MEVRRQHGIDGASAPMHAISVVAACAPRSTYVEYAPLRCSAAPRIWRAWITESLVDRPVANL
jgi:hypothetical protein